VATESASTVIYSAPITARP